MPDLTELFAQAFSAFADKFAEAIVPSFLLEKGAV